MLAYNNTIANSHVFNCHQLHVKGHNYDSYDNISTNTNNNSRTTSISLSTYTNNTSSSSKSNNSNSNSSSIYNNISISYYNSDFTKIDQLFGHTTPTTTTTNNNNKVYYKYIFYYTIRYYAIPYYTIQCIWYVVCTCILYLQVHL